MDDTTRSAQNPSDTPAAPPSGHDVSQPDQAGPAGHTPGTGWSNPGGDATAAARAPWVAGPNDTGVISRPTDTQVIAGASAPGAVPLGSGNVPPGTTPPGAVPPAGAVPPMETFPSPEPRNKAGRGTALIVTLALGAGLLGGAGGAAIYDTLRDDSPAPVSSLDSEPRENTSAANLSSVEEVAEQLAPSVVSIGIDGPSGRGGGSGVIISSDGQILTNNHVAEASQGGRLTVTFHDGRTVEAEVLGLDPLTDLAVIQAADASDLQPADLGNSDDLRVGEQVIAFGSPLGLDGTVTSGIVSALNRPVTAGGGQGGNTTTFDAIQTDAPINPGNSGGPLVNMAGQVVGINSAIAQTFGSEGSIGLGFSIPINQARYIADQLIDSGSAQHARIGIGVNDAPADTPGALVANIEPGSAAERAGLEEGDVITHIDDRLITDAESLVAAARSRQPGETVTLTYVRDGETGTVELTLGSSAPTT
jgi:putative serine protease PepD